MIAPTVVVLLAFLLAIPRREPAGVLDIAGMVLIADIASMPRRGRAGVTVSRPS